MKRYATANGHAKAHGTLPGTQAIIVGAGIAGLAAAGALAEWFERVIVLERDLLSDAATCRAGTPQARHSHGLLVGGQLALEKLFPGLGMILSVPGVCRSPSTRTYVKSSRMAIQCRNAISVGPATR
jgi:hypothetical protein